MKPNLFRFFAAFALLAGLALSAIQPAAASGSTTLQVVAVKPGETVTIRAYNFPGGHLFNVRMDKAGNNGLNGVLADVTNTGAGGNFQETYKIPATLKNEASLTIRLESSDGYFAYDTFTNQGSSQPTGAPTSTPVSTTNKASIDVLKVDQNKTVRLHASNFPANTSFSVRVGPFYSFFRDYVITGTINSGKGGSFDFDVTLPSVVKDVELVTVRLDGGGSYAYNAFRNVTGGGALTPVPTSGPTATPTPTSTPAANTCQVTAVVLNGPVTTGSNFDAVWTIKNTSSVAWDQNAVDYKFVSGASVHKKSAYDLKATVAAGASANFIVDMLAPATKGSYTETWAVVQGSKTLCTMSVTMNIK